MHDKKLYGTATVGTKGQVVIPADARDELGIVPGDRLYVIGSCEKHYIGLIKEDVFRELVGKIADNIDSYKQILDSVQE